jgi:tRNA pseudouridine38-40 synthase
MNSADRPGDLELTPPGAGSVGIRGSVLPAVSSVAARVVPVEAESSTGGEPSSSTAASSSPVGDPPTFHSTGSVLVGEDSTNTAHLADADAANAGDLSGLLRLRLDISYDGTSFSGWAAQPGRRTVAGELSSALATLFRTPVPLVVAGRTDAGVHAIGQVAHIDVAGAALVALARRPQVGVIDAGSAVERGLMGLLRRLAGLLPADVRVRQIRVATDGFDARFAALRRHYRYRIAATGFGAEPLRRFDTLAWSRPLDVSSMVAASRGLLGLHDFAAYCKPPAHDGASTIRQLQRLDVVALPAESGVIAVDVTADAFCHSMVRSLVGALIAVGEGRFEVLRPAELLAARVRTSAIHAVPAHGLTLLRVDYPPDSELTARAAMTRAVRSAGEGSPAVPE